MKDDFESYFGGDDTFLPDGWDGKSDIFSDDGVLNEEAFIRDGGEDEPAPAASENEVGQTDEEYLTKVASDQPDDETAGAVTETKADEKETKEKAPRVLKLKVNHEEQEIDIDSMSDDDLIALLQKGKAFDAAKDAEKKQLYRTVYQQQIDAGMTEDAAELIAERKAGKHYSLTDDEPEAAPEPEQKREPEHKQPRNFREEVEQLKALYPDFKEMPDEVAREIAKGEPLLNAYLAYREKQSNKTAAELRKENNILKQNAASAAKAPVKGVSGGGDSTPKRTDYFIKGFDDDPW